MLGTLFNASLRFVPSQLGRSFIGRHSETFSLPNDSNHSCDYCTSVDLFRVISVPWFRCRDLDARLACSLEVSFEAGELGMLSP